MSKQSGFTVIELIIITIFMLASAIVLFLQYQNLQNRFINQHKRTSINAIYFSLEEAFYKQNSFYPESITDDTLPTMDKGLLTDPDDRRLGEEGSVYRYEPKNCKDGQCKSYSLRATLEGEADFVRNSRNR